MKPPALFTAVLALVFVACAPATPPATTAPTAISTELPTATAEPTPTPEPLPHFTVHSGAVLKPGQLRDDLVFVHVAGLVIEDGTFHLIWQGIDETFKQFPIGHCTSTDAITWENCAEVAIENVPAIVAPDNLFDPTHLRHEADGSWSMLMVLIPRGEGRDTLVYRATAAAPEGPWTVGPDPLLAGTPGEWDAESIDAASIVEADSGPLMFYSTRQQGDTGEIGLATSSDGLTWERYGDPVLEPGARDDWNPQITHRPRVIRTPDGYVMVYRSYTEFGNNAGYGIATSADGVTWAHHPANPVLRFRDVPGATNVYWADMVYVDGVYYLMFEVVAGDTGAIWLATYDGSFAGG
jgi:predicted GH43/DUF377 family glycosyl hydrolase